MDVRRIAAALVLTAAGGLALSGCQGASDPVPTRTVTVTATASASASASATPSTTPTAASTTPSSAVPVSTPRPGEGCSPTDVSIDIGMQHRIGDVDGDGRADTEFYTADRPLRFGVRTASGATIVLDDDLPGEVHRGLVGVTEGGFRAVIADERTAEAYVLADCRFTRIVDADGRPFSVTFRRPATAAGTSPSGLLCTDLNGGEFLATARAQQRSDGRWDVWWGILQGRGDRVDPDPLTGDPIFTDLPASDPRVGNAFTSSCNDAPVVLYPDA